MDLPLDGAALRAAQEGRREFSNGRWHEMPIRSVYVAVSTGGVPGDRVVHVAASLDPIRSLQRNLALIFAGIVLLGFAATFVGAWSIAGSVVRPVAEITQQAAQIEAGTLAQRISAHATTDEYRGLVAVLNRMLERLDGAFRAQRRFTGDVSHELRTPLTALRGEIEVALRSEREPREYQRVLWSALEEIERLTSMTEDLLLIARAESHLVVPQRVSSDVNAVLRSALDQMRQRIAEKRLTVETVFDAANRMAPLDAGLVTRLVRNLVDNAVKFAPVGGQLKVVSGSDDGGGVRLRIENPGPPIAPEDLPHVFEPFYRADRARSRGTGTGLGLAVAAAIARLHGGEIRAGSRNGAGVWVEVDLPAPERS
jgi:two-component system OmpR family sensor kinase